MNGFSEHNQNTYAMPLFGKISFFIKLLDCASIFVKLKMNGENIKYGVFSQYGKLSEMQAIFGNSKCFLSCGRIFKANLPKMTKTQNCEIFSKYFKFDF